MFSLIAKHMLETILKHYQNNTLNQTKMIVQNVDHSQTKFVHHIRYTPLI